MDGREEKNDRDDYACVEVYKSIYMLAWPLVIFFIAQQQDDGEWNISTQTIKHLP